MGHQSLRNVLEEIEKGRGFGRAFACALGGIIGSTLGSFGTPYYDGKIEGHLYLVASMIVGLPAVGAACDYFKRRITDNYQISESER